MPDSQRSDRSAAAVAESPITSHDLCAALRLEHPADEYVVLFEVREGSGTMYGSRADAIVLSLYATRGFELTGFEFKCQRGDWLAELRNPEKAERIARYCDRWCVFAAPGVVREAELPVGWGLWELTAAGGIRRRVQPALREAEPLPRAFLASLLRARARLEPDDLMAFVAQHRRDWEKQQRTRPGDPAAAGPAGDRDEARLREGLRKLDEIREATGIDLRDFTPGRRWIERLRLVGSPSFEHKLRLLRDLFSDDELRERVDRATRPERDADVG